MRFGLRPGSVVVEALGRPDEVVDSQLEKTRVNARSVMIRDKTTHSLYLFISGMLGIAIDSRL
jgi:hypothetical protein